MYMLEIPASLNFVLWMIDNKALHVNEKRPVVSHFITLDGMNFIKRHNIDNARLMFDYMERKLFISFDTEEEAFMFKLKML